jgi:hypothetical protein
MAPGAAGIAGLERLIDEGLKPLGVNALVLEINGRFQFQSHPEMNDRSGFSRDQARALASFCRDRGIRLIPQFNCLGHQSWGKTPGFLLKAHPEFEETPTPETLADKEFYCRSWCPNHPDVNALVFDLIDELADAFEADAFHVGMDEVFVIGSDACPRCRGKATADLFAKAVNDLHAHIAGTRGMTMMMWADRLLDAKAMGYGPWEAASNGTAAAVDRVPKDIIMCDWHYEPLSAYRGRPTSYGSVAFLTGKGFRVWPAGWRDAEAVRAFMADALAAEPKERVLGYLATTWMSPDAFARALLEPDSKEKIDPKARGAVEAMRAGFDAAGR